MGPGGHGERAGEGLESSSATTASVGASGAAGRFLSDPDAAAGGADIRAGPPAHEVRRQERVNGNRFAAIAELDVVPAK